MKFRPTDRFDFALIRHLALKDWELFLPFFLTLLIVDLGLLFLRPSLDGIYFGDIVVPRRYVLDRFMTAMPLAMAHLAMLLGMRSRQAEAQVFLTTLPIARRDLLGARLTVQLLPFLVPWTLLLTTEIFAIASRAFVPDGLIPFVALALLTDLALYCLILGLAIHPEPIWNHLAFGLGFLLIWGVGRFDTFPHRLIEPVRRDSAAFSGFELGLLAALLASIGLALALPFFLPSIKKDAV